MGDDKAVGRENESCVEGENLLGCEFQCLECLSHDGLASVEALLLGKVSEIS